MSAKTIKVVIVDDQQDAVNFTHSLLQKYFPNLEISGTANSVEEGVQLIEETKPQLAFVDVEMGDGTGFDLVQRIEHDKMKIVFITGFDKFALRALKLGALDYLLKPVDIEEFIDTADKAIAAIRKDQMDDFNPVFNNLLDKKPKNIALKMKDQVVFIAIKDVVMVKADRSYCEFYVSDGKKHVVSKNLKYYTDVLEDQGFFRSHQSYLVNLDFLEAFQPNDGLIVMQGELSALLSRAKKKEFSDVLETQIYS